MKLQKCRGALGFELIEQPKHAVAINALSSSQFSKRSVAGQQRPPVYLGQRQRETIGHCQLPLRLSVTHCHGNPLAVERFDPQSQSQQLVPTVFTQLALVQHVGDREGGRQFEGALDQLATLKVTGPKYRTAESSFFFKRKNPQPRDDRADH
jgi:hypothetical protein